MGHNLYVNNLVDNFSPGGKQRAKAPLLREPVVSCREAVGGLQRSVGRGLFSLVQGPKFVSINKVFCLDFMPGSHSVCD